MEPDEMKCLVAETERAWRSLGTITYGATENEKPSMLYRRSLYTTRDMVAGEVFSADNVRCVRPGYGLQPKYLGIILGKKVSRDVKAGTPIKWELIE